MRAHRLLVACASFAAIVATRIPSSHATEICGNGVDDDSNGLADEGCMPSVTTGVCESPLDCGLNGAVSPSTGALTYNLAAADIAPAVPYGPRLAMQRFYTSAYDPGSGAPAYRKPMGEHWQHAYMSWLDKNGTDVVVHTTQGQDVLFTYASTSGGYDYYTPQAGFHFLHFRHATSSPYHWELKTLDGDAFVYDYNSGSGVGKLIEEHDTLATPNVLTITYDTNGQVDTVTDASGVRRLVFGYTSGKLTSVAFQTVSGGTPTTQTTATYAYTSGAMTSWSIGGKLVHTYTYSGGLLTLIEDADGNDLATFAYETGSDKVVRLDTGDGAIGYEYNSGRSSCSGKTVLYFNAPTSISCDDDSDCASVSTDLVCGGETNQSASNTGKCYYAGRCLTVTSPNEHLVTTVAPVAPSGGTCDGACTDVAEYSWNTSVTTLKGVKDPENNWTSYTYNSDGLPTLIVRGDSDDDATNSGGNKTWLFYGNSSFPGRITEVRRASVGGGTCDATTSSGCKRTLMTYTTDGQLDTVEETGYTLNSSNSWITYDYTTDYDYDSTGRFTQIDGPLSGSNDVTDYEYFSSTNVYKNGFLQKYKRKKDSANYVTTEILDYDGWAMPTMVADPDATLTCFSNDPDQGFVTERREKMAGQTACTHDSTDLVTTWERDTVGRLRKIQRPGGTCTFNGYDSLGRLSTVKRRDDCNSASAGDTETYTYADGDRVTKIEIADASSTVTERHEVSYYESRRLRGQKDPASGYSSTRTYDGRGLVTQEDAPSSLGKTVHLLDEQGREYERRDYTTSSTYDAWTLTYYYLFYHQPLTVTDADSKAITTTYDDMDRLVRQVTPDTATTIWAYDEAGRVVARNEAYGTAGSQLHAFSYDNLGRSLTEDYLSSCGTGAGPEVERVWDAPPVTCPTGAGCASTGGRLAYVKTSLFCNTSLSDKSYDQETFYSYDDAGRMLTQYIQDDGGRVATQTFTWTKDGALESQTTPSGVTLGATFGASGNSDGDRVASLWRGSSTTPLIESATWFPFGGLSSYLQENTISGHQLQTVVSRDLGGRISDVLVEDSVNSTDVFDVAVTRDDKGRVIERNYTGGASGLQDSVFTYDDLDRVLCEATGTGASCPTSGSTLKNNISGSPPYTAGGDRVEFRHAIPGYSTTLHQISLVSGAHRIDHVDQPSAYGQTDFGWYAKGDRAWETNYGYDVRGYGYDDRRNLVSANGFFKPTSSSSWHTYYLSASFDERNRRVAKGIYDATTTQFSFWYFYYDPMDRLVEIKYWPDTSSASTYSIFQINWLDARAVAIFQTDYPGGTLSRRYVHNDQDGKPIELYSWPTSGDATRGWAIDPDSSDNDTIVTGSGVFEPVLGVNGYRDEETAAWHDYAQMQRPPLIQSSATYDPWVGIYAEAAGGAENELGTNSYTSRIEVDSPFTVVLGVFDPFIGCQTIDNGDTFRLTDCLDDWMGWGYVPGGHGTGGGTGGGGGGGGGGTGGGSGSGHPTPSPQPWHPPVPRNCPQTCGLSHDNPRGVIFNCPCPDQMPPPPSDPCPPLREEFSDARCFWRVNYTSWHCQPGENLCLLGECWTYEECQTCARLQTELRVSRCHQH